MRESIERPVRLVLACLALTGIALAGACKESVIASTQTSPASSETVKGHAAGEGSAGDSTQQDDSAGLKPPKDAAGPKAADTVTISGLLKSGYVGIGGEHTGWMLVPSAKKGDAIEVDVGKVMSEAKQLDGRAVTITGRMVIKSYVERGKVRVLVADALAAGPT